MCKSRDNLAVSVARSASKVSIEALECHGVEAVGNDEPISITGGKPEDLAAKRNEASCFHNQTQSSALSKIKLHAIATPVFAGISCFAMCTLGLRKLMRSGSHCQKKQSRTEATKNEIGLHMDIPTVDCGSLESSRPALIQEVRKLVSEDKPLVLKNVPKEYFQVLKEEKYDKPEDFPGQVSSGEYLIMDSWFLPQLGKRLQRLITDLLFHRPIFMARFRGGYRSSAAHIDSGAMYNFYYVNEGKKRVTLIPSEFSSLIELAPGHDSVLFPGSDVDDAFGSQYPGFYQFVVEAGDVLIFNNCAVLHKFENMTGKEDIYTIRVSSFSTPCNETLANDMFNYKNALHIASEIANSRTTRAISYT